jgi:2',3'-cyclic-nucleotide 2'-phosphodiesterase (5'-nucleotidase family)
MMNLLGYDAMALGEGDLGILGLAAIQERMGEASFPVLSANAIREGTEELLAEPYVIREIDGLQVAIIGLTGQALVKGVEFREPTQALREVIDEIGDRAGVMILLSHAGLATNRQIAEEFPQLDVIVSGGGNAVTAVAERKGDGPVTVHADLSTPGHAGRKLGIGTWYFGRQGELVQHDWTDFALTPDVADDPTMLEWVRRNS